MSLFWHQFQFKERKRNTVHPHILRFVSSTIEIDQILVHSHFELGNSLLSLDATEPVSKPVTQMTVPEWC